MATMSADAVGRSMPDTITLGHLAAMNDADEHGHRYELSPEGALSVTYEVATKMPLAWLLQTSPADHKLDA
jgi:hypothetical protein